MILSPEHGFYFNLLQNFADKARQKKENNRIFLCVYIWITEEGTLRHFAKSNIARQLLGEHYKREGNLGDKFRGISSKKRHMSLEPRGTEREARTSYKCRKYVQRTRNRIFDIKV